MEWFFSGDSWASTSESLPLKRRYLTVDMLRFALENNRISPLRLLCLGAHCDDIEIGCGGTILKLTHAGRELEVHWVVFSSNDQRNREAVKSAGNFLEGVPNRNIEIHSLRDGFLPYIGAELKDRFENLKTVFSPDLIFTHYRHDLHQDHRLVSELTWNTFRNHLILEYEIPKFDGDFGSPNLFVPLEESVCSRKMDVIFAAYQSQREKHWFTRELFSSVLRVRGMEANSGTGYAEGFYCRKVNLQLEV
jgi:LmbE family N-acetylglucosaminyl deacetylase